MSLTIQPLGILKDYTGGEGFINLPTGLTIRQILSGLGIPAEVVALVVVNGEIQDKEYLPQDGDIVKLLAIIGGG